MEEADAGQMRQHIEWQPKQHKPREISDLRGAKRGPKGYKERTKRKLEEMEELAEQDVQGMDVADESGACAGPGSKRLRIESSDGVPYIPVRVHVTHGTQASAVCQEWCVWEGSDFKLRARAGFRSHMEAAWAPCGGSDEAWRRLHQLGKEDGGQSSARQLFGAQAASSGGSTCETQGAWECVCCGRIWSAVGHQSTSIQTLLLSQRYAQADAQQRKAAEERKKTNRAKNEITQTVCVYVADLRWCSLGPKHICRVALHAHPGQAVHIQLNEWCCTMLLLLPCPNADHQQRYAQEDDEEQEAEEAAAQG
jgi:hypothetical protein